MKLIARGSDVPKSIFEVGKKVTFEEEALPYTVMAVSDRFAVCTRPLHRRVDADLLWSECNNRAYDSFTSAYNSLKDCPVYTLVDFDQGLRAGDDSVFGLYYYSNKAECELVIEALKAGDIGLSRRTAIDLLVVLK